MVLMMFTEKGTVEDYIINQLQKFGWQYIPPQKLPRESYEEPLLTSMLTSTIQRINKADLSESDLRSVINALKYKSTDVEGIKSILGYLKSGISIKPEKENVLKRIKLIENLFLEFFFVFYEFWFNS